MQMYYNNFESIRIQQTETSMCYGISKIDKGWDFDEIVNYVGTGRTNNISFYSKDFSKYNITKEIIEKSLWELIGDRYLKRGNPNINKIFFCDKGKQHHLNEKSFEIDYINNHKTSRAINLAIIAIIISMIPFFSVLFKFILNYI